ncbi:uncharacterized protein LOC110435905 [Sorghum bicolor]|uniref:uncharacterized protein LOC110435905 n=1 Tax=Sorghum bicolor TaxID=4558 RepID=UPI000B4247F4|nr:uncharacterized protein LOC110435905 [Sorghum bicolor]|eukprot:XP_021317682.1 uncharacterized protein LOC110435905 [Sorghum bicolor]
MAGRGAVVAACREAAWGGINNHENFIKLKENAARWLRPSLQPERCTAILATTAVDAAASLLRSSQQPHPHMRASSLLRRRTAILAAHAALILALVRAPLLVTATPPADCTSPTAFFDFVNAFPSDSVRGVLVPCFSVLSSPLGVILARRSFILESYCHFPRRWSSCPSQVSMERCAIQVCQIANFK